jgi:hypothetical protein
MLLECQKIYQREKNNFKAEEAIKASFSEEFKDYCNCHQWINFDDFAVFNDREGQPVMIDSYSLDGSDGSNNTSPLPRSFLR